MNKYENYKDEIKEGKRTHNQIRKEIGLPTVNGGDTAFIDREIAFCRKIQERR